MDKATASGAVDRGSIPFQGANAYKGRRPFAFAAFPFAQPRTSKNFWAAKAGVGGIVNGKCCLLAGSGTGETSEARSGQRQERASAFFLMVAPQGFEPRHTVPETVVLPLDEGAVGRR